jgi:hypothetical protein
LAEATVTREIEASPALPERQGLRIIRAPKGRRMEAIGYLGNILWIGNMTLMQ